MRGLGLLTLFFMTTCGCMRTAVVKFWEPAAIDVSRLNRIVVLEFQGDQGRLVSSSLTSQLWKNEFYTVVDRTSLSGELQLASHEESPQHDVNLHELLASVRAQGIDGVLTGEVLEYRCEDKRVRRIAGAAANGGGGLGQNRTGASGSTGELRDNLLREGVVTISFRLIDVESGEIRAAQQVTHRYSGDQEAVGERLPSQEEVLEQLTQKCLADIVGMLAPHEATSTIQLAASDVWTRGRREVKEGNRHAVEGNWDLAEEQWKAALEIEPRNHAALFNLAVAADHRHDYTAAEDLAMQALRLQHKTCYTTGLDMIRAHRGAAVKSEEQRDSRVVTVIDAGWR